MPLQKWTHLAATYRNKTWKLYVDGNLAGQRRVKTGPPWTGRKLTIGANAPEGREPFLGAIDDLRIYRRALRAAEISELAR